MKNRIIVHYSILDIQINARAEKLGTVLRNDDDDVFINRFLFGLASTGAVLPYCALDKNLTVFPGMSAKRMCEHQLNNFLFLSWIDQSEHANLFKAFFVNSAGTDNFALQERSKSRIASATSSYLSKSSPILRNPFLIGWIPPDVWLALSFLALIYLVIQEKYLAALIVAAIGINFLVTFHFPLGNARYAYSLVPLYFVVMSVAVSKCWSLVRGTFQMS